MKLLVLGGGTAGLAMALAAGRGGHEVVLAERDSDAPAGNGNGVFEGWQRTGVAQFRQPHNFLGLGRRLLRDRAPDVYRELLAAGAVEVEQFRFLAGAAPEPGDQDLATIGCRRPVFEAALRRAVETQPAIDLRAGCRVTGLLLSGGRPAHVEGVVLAGGERLAADLVVDASGRSGRTIAWLAEAGLGASPSAARAVGSSTTAATSSAATVSPTRPMRRCWPARGAISAMWPTPSSTATIAPSDWSLWRRPGTGPFVTFGTQRPTCGRRSCCPGWPPGSTRMPPGRSPRCCRSGR
jgi:2-polyprenyl-6-methoxyphenol hydroxylase-like FAD-dependent oxidoreductase